MATFQVTDPQTGKTVRLTGDSPPTEQELIDIFSRIGGQQPTQQSQQDLIDSDIPTEEALQAEQRRAEQFRESQQEGLLTQAKGVGEAALTFGTGATTGALGLLTGNALGALGELTGFLDQGEGERLGERLAGEFTYIPETKTGQDIVKGIGDLLAPLPPVLGTAPLTTAGGLTRLASKTPPAKRAKLSRQLIAEQIRAGNPNTELVTKTLTEAGEVVTNKTAKRSLDILKRSIGEDRAVGTVSVLETMSPTSKKQVNKMLDIIDKGRIDPVFGQTNRPSDILGDAVANRAKAIHTINERASKQIGSISKGIDKTVDISAPVNRFEQQLRDLGVTFSIGDDGWITPDFSRSRFVGGSQKDLTVLINSLKNPKKKFAKAHELKRDIRDNIDFDSIGQSQLKGQSEQILKELSRGIDNILDETSPKYKKANESFAKTVAIKDAFEKLAGRDVGIFNDLSTKALGGKARRLVSNAESRVGIEQLLLAADDTLGKFGVKFKDDIPTLGYIVSRLEDTFKIEPPRSFQGGIESALTRVAQGQGVAQTALEGVLQTGKKLIGRGDPDFGKKMRAFRSLTKKEQGKK